MGWFSKKKANPDIRTPRRVKNLAKNTSAIPVSDKFGAFTTTVQALEFKEGHHNAEYKNQHGYTSLITLKCSMGHVNYVYNIPVPVYRIGSERSRMPVIDCMDCTERMEGGEIYINGEKVEPKPLPKDDSEPL